MVWFGNTAVYLYIGRVFAGATGGGMYICLPLFVAEIADQRLVERKIFITKKHIHSDTLIYSRMHTHIKYTKYTAIDQMTGNVM